MTILTIKYLVYSTIHFSDYQLHVSYMPIINVMPFTPFGILFLYHFGLKSISYDS